MLLGALGATVSAGGVLSPPPSSSESLDDIFVTHCKLAYAVSYMTLCGTAE